jgi:hypothetical protein
MMLNEYWMLAIGYTRLNIRACQLLTVNCQLRLVCGFIRFLIPCSPQVAAMLAGEIVDLIYFVDGAIAEPVDDGEDVGAVVADAVYIEPVGGMAVADAFYAYGAIAGQQWCFKFKSLIGFHGG